MPKKLVIFCDGTWNSADHTGGNTNVFRLFQAVKPYDRGRPPHPQVVHYTRGVGTRKQERIRGGGFGFGISENIKDAYAFIVSNYERGDEIFLFGFSRGAYTSRSVAGLIRNMGILKRDKMHLVDEAYELYKDRSPEWHPDSWKSRCFREKHTHQYETVKFLGVWDTVGALGAPFGSAVGWIIYKLFRCGFHDVQLSSIVENAYHALAIDERRWPFRPTLWTLNPEQIKRNEAAAAAGTVPRYEEKWFPGVHSNVGGGYVYPSSKLSDCALEWMAKRAGHHGLNLDLNKVSDPDFMPDPMESVGDSQTFCYRVLTLLFVKLPSLFSRRLVFPKENRSLVGDIRLNGDYVRPIDNHGNVADAVAKYPNATAYSGQISGYAVKKFSAYPRSYWPCNIQFNMKFSVGDAVEIAVDPAKHFQETGLQVAAGEEYAFEAHGEWADASRRCGPEGWSAWWTRPFLRFSRMPDKDFFYLCGNVSQSDSVNFAIGQQTVERMKIDGKLYLFANDIYWLYWNNNALTAEEGGPMRVKIRRTL